MCLYPKVIRNRKYTANKKNGGIIPPVTDERVQYVPIGCQECIECRKQKARGWQVRMLEEIKHRKDGKFITLTFSNEWIHKIINGYETGGKWVEGLQGSPEGYTLDNAIATKAMRGFLERWRKKYKKSLRHWIVTELGHEGTENIHMHGIIWTKESKETINERWQYGNIWIGDYVNEKTVNYIIKYVTKVEEKHKTYKSIILTSPGIGKNYTEGADAEKNKYNNKKTIETYKTRSGHKISMPVYWRNKIYTEEEREKLWLQKLDKQERWVRGEKIDISNGEEEYYKVLKWYRKENSILGYGNGEHTWERHKYERERRIIMQKKRINKCIDYGEE